MIQYFLISLFLLVNTVLGSPGGAPNTCCEAMVPAGHGVAAQPGAPSFFSTVPNTVLIQFSKQL